MVVLDQTMSAKYERPDESPAVATVVNCGGTIYFHSTFITS
jgi:hypothetical protein